MLAARLKDLQVTPTSIEITNKGLKVPQAHIHGPKLGVPARISGSLWLPAEDEKLLRIVQSVGPFNWKDVAHSFETRSWFACQKRYEKLAKSHKDFIEGDWHIAKGQSVLEDRTII